MNPVFELVASLTLDSSQYESGLGQATSAADSMGNALVGGLGKAAQLAGGAIAAASGAVVAFGASSIKTGMDFDSSMSQVAATMGKTTDEITNLRDFAQEMGATTAFSATEAAEALNYMALAGYDAETSMQMLPTVLDLAAAGGMDLASASDMVTDAQSALGLSLDDTTKMVDQMAKTSSKTNTSVAQLGEAMLTIGATARGVKGGTVELSQVLGVLADNGIKSAEGGTHLRNAILSLQTSTKSGVEALEKLGMSYDDMYDSAGNMRALPEIFLELQSKMEGMTQASKDAIISGIFNKTDLAAINALVGTSAERWEQLEKEITDSSGAAKAMADTQLDNLQGQITLMQSALEGVQIAVSDKIAPALRDFVEMGSEGLGQMAEAIRSGDMNKAIDIFTDILSKALDKVMAELPKVIDMGVKILGALVQGITNALPTLANSAMQLLTMLGNYITQYAPMLIAAVPSLLSELATGIHQALNLIVDVAVDIITALADGLVTALPELAEQAPTIIGELLAALIENVPKLLEAGLEIIAAIFNGTQDALPILLENLPTMFEKVGEAIKQVDWIGLGMALIEAVAAGLRMCFFTIPTLLLSIGQMAFEYLKTVDWIQLGKNVVTLVVNGVQNFFNKLPDKIREIGDTAHRWFKSIDWKQLGKDTITMIKNGVNFLFNELPNLLQNIGTEAFQTLQSIDWLSLGEDIINGIINGVQNLASALVDTVSSIASDAYDAVKDFFDINSPSKKMIWIGEMVDKGLTKGIEDSADLVKDAMNDISVVPEVQTSAFDAGTALGNSENATSNTSNNNVVINVYGAVGQDMNELAEIIEQKITAATRRREGAFA